MFNPGVIERIPAEIVDPRWGADLVFAEDYDRLLSLYRQFVIAKPISEYHEDLGPCLWWIFPICEPPYSGTPMDCDWPEYHTHFTRLTNEMCPRPENGQPS